LTKAGYTSKHSR